MAKTLVENLTANWDPSRYHDRYRNELLDLLERKAEGEPLPEPSAQEGGDVVDLMEALRESVDATKKRTRAGPEGSKEPAEAQSFLACLSRSTAASATRR